MLVLLRMLHEVLLRKLVNMLLKMLRVVLQSFLALFGDLRRVTLVGQPYVTTFCVTSWFISQS